MEESVLKLNAKAITKALLETNERGWSIISTDDGNDGEEKKKRNL